MGIFQVAFPTFRIRVGCYMQIQMVPQFYLLLIFAPGIEFRIFDCEDFCSF